MSYPKRNVGDLSDCRISTELADRTNAYLDQEAASVRELRQRDMPDFPWPAEDNPALELVLAEARHYATQARSNAEKDQAVTWAAVHGWFEGALYALHLMTTLADPKPA